MMFWLGCSVLFYERELLVIWILLWVVDILLL